MAYTKKTASRPRRKTTKSISRPFRRVGGTVARSIFGRGSWGHNAGKAVGSAIGTLFGSGDYNGPMVRTNSIINPQSTPGLQSGGPSSGDSVVIRKTEFIQDIVSSGTPNTFETQTFELNPGQNSTFPFLANIAKNYEEYRLRGMVFHFKSLSGDSTSSTQSGLGYVAMATQYDSLDGVFTTKSEIENYSMSQSGKPSIDQLHGIECAAHVSPLSHLYVRPFGQPADTDIRLYDFGKTTIATSCPGTSVTLGELHVSYDIELYKPKLTPVPTNLLDAFSSRIQRTGSSSGSPNFGTIGQLVAGNITASASPNSVTYSGLNINLDYIFVATHNLSNSGTYTVAPIISISVGTAVNNLIGSSFAIKTSQQNVLENAADKSNTVLFVKPSSEGTITIICSNGTSSFSNYGVNLLLTSF